MNLNFPKERRKRIAFFSCFAVMKMTRVVLLSYFQGASCSIFSVFSLQLIMNAIEGQFHVFLKRIMHHVAEMILW